VRVTYTPTVEATRSISTVVGGLFASPRAAGATFGQAGGEQGGPTRRFALDGVNLEVRHGETLGVLGASGCGKSTLLRAIAGLSPLTSGTITYDDVDMATVPVGERGIGIVFQNYALYPTMTSFENVGFFFRIRQREAEIPERVREVSRVMGIGFRALLGRQPYQLSGGERQRVAVARCIARDPKLFLFDEPLSNLDAKLRTQTRAELKRLVNKYRVTGVYVTHDQNEALAICDRIAIMHEGRIEQVGTAQFLLEHPASTLIASFFGAPPMNLFNGVMVGSVWHGEDFIAALGARAPGEGKQVTLGLRAEAITPAADGPLRGEVLLVEPLPVQRALLLYVETARGRISAQAPQESALRAGDQVVLAVDTARVHLFDARTGRRL
jgi:multiple sugar transport system ATP-binding protein